MAYLDIDDIVNYTGFVASDFKENGKPMTKDQFDTLCEMVIDAVTKTINNFCSVITLESNDVTEYHSGKSGSKSDGTYEYFDRTYYLRENCISVATVYEDTNPNGIPAWTARTPRSSLVAGDYKTITKNGTTVIEFINNIPIEGNDNIKVLYSAGFSEGSTELDHIKYIAVRLAANYLTLKKKLQESTTIRRAATEDYSKMFELANGDNVLTKELRNELTPYRRWVVDIWSM